VQFILVEINMVRKLLYENCSKTLQNVTVTNLASKLHKHHKTCTTSLM